MFGKHLLSKKGFTLIELVIVLGILGMIVMVAYPMLSLTYKTSTAQLKESNQRNEVRSASANLKSDIEYSRDITVNTTALHIINSRGETIDYSIENSGGISYLIRKKGTITTSFKDIQAVEFQKLNDHLIRTKLINDPVNNKFSEFKIYRFNMTVDTPANETIQEYIINHGIFVLGNSVSLSGSSTIAGNDATVIVRQSLDLQGANVQYISTKNIYIQGDVNLGGSAGLGKLDKSSSIYITGNCSMTGAANLYGKVIVEGNFSTSTPEINGNIYVDGDVHFGDGNYSSMKGHIYYTGTLTKPSYITDLPVTKVASVEDIVFPTITIPQMPTASWYAERGYTSSNTPRNNMKFYGDRMDFSGSGSYSNVIIASKGDINISGSVNVTGILYAPYGKVTVSGSSTFKGLIFSNQSDISGSTDVTFVVRNINDLPF